MNTIFLRFADRPEALALLGAVGLTAETETGPVLLPLVMTAAGPVYPDLVFGTGVIALPTGALDGDGLPVLAPVEGCHVNLLAPDGWPLAGALASKVVTPDSPVCVFAG
ncbi:hypothetical protein C2U72_27790 [Prosthecomicrobium hirschii]|uniref:hypothetical protein n=1 Tax=Prosthecodimorpha hirschii TaxID=665126 RepID=UPI001129DC2D|nr:hypothetical protein [Prosthecomicrobium hirschii]TPQ44422.1 hypothetical protein C2U72_27790 [Prosthecomicrobium hirschii]